MAERLRGPLLTLAAASLLVVLLSVASVAAGGGHSAAACAFLRTPSAYEAGETRAIYLGTIEAAALDALFPGDPYFGLPPVEFGVRGERTDGSRRVPATLLKAIAWEESTLTMASRATHFESTGTALVSFDCGHGVMQVTTGMTVPLGIGGVPSSRQVNVATHFGYNIARGAVILADKWNAASGTRPVVGIDTGSNPTLVENWYFATWGYNGFAGPGSFSSNHPQDPSFGAWPRPAYRCDGTQSRRRYPYQELVWGCMASPPARDGAPLWRPVAATLPDLSQPQFFEPLSLRNWLFPYNGMDIPTPQPPHADIIIGFQSGGRELVARTPGLAVNERSVLIQLNGLPQAQRAEVEIENTGGGILSWIATSDDAWIVVDPPAGVALGPDVACEAPECDHPATITVTVNPTLLAKASTVGAVRIVATNAALAAWSLRVEVDADFEVAAPGTSRAD
ncbi:MAG: hypothetical protein QF664_05135 [Dehalococcoidia bacterium]|nr:hypothetical protein [Dehalococcoidia bacterium]